MTVHEWLAEGVAAGFCSEAVCETHDGLPSTPEEQEAWDQGFDPCIYATRLYPDGRPADGGIVDV